MQIDDPARGFSVKADGPLDMRMNPRRGQPAAALLESIGAAELSVLLRDGADEPRADALAAVLAGRRFDTTGMLAAAGARPATRKRCGAFSRRCGSR
jgi:16S rRNA (cytosine1402-N4)-methyltransferase